MAESREKEIKLALNYAITIFKTLKAEAQCITENAVATFALLQAVAEKFPEIADSFERHQKSIAHSAPIAVKARQTCDHIDVIMKQLERLKT